MAAMDLKNTLDELAALGMSQAKIGAEIGVSQTIVSRMMRGVQKDIGSKKAERLRLLHRKAMRKHNREQKNVTANQDADGDARANAAS